MPDEQQQFGGDLAPAAPAQQPLFGSGLFSLGMNPPQYTVDPNASPLDQAANQLQQQIRRAGQVGTDPRATFFFPEQAAAARAFVPKAAEQLQLIERQKADIAAGRREMEVLGLAPGEVSDQATHEDRVVAAQTRALRGDLKSFQGLQARDPMAAESIAEQVHSAVSANLGIAQTGFDKLSSARNQGQYTQALKELRDKHELGALEALGLKVPDNQQVFEAAKGREAEALRNARQGVDTIRQKLEARNTAQPMEEKEAKTYNNAWKTVYGDAIAGQPSRMAPPARV
jgi:hypothetical protein